MEIKFTISAVDDLRFFKASERKRILEEVEIQLSTEPLTETRNKKKLRPNQVSEWEIRIGSYRVFYDVDADLEMVIIAAVGYKEGNALYIRGKRYQL